MCFGGGDSNTSSQSSGSASANVTFNPTITIGSNAGEPAQDTKSTFAAQLLAAPPVRIEDPAPPAKSDQADDPQRKLLIFVAVALAARKVLHG